MTTAYAAVSPEGAILVNTVSSTDRAAMVNFLVAYANFMVPAGMGDFAIREHFDRLSKLNEIKIERVVLSRAKAPDSTR